MSRKYSFWTGGSGSQRELMEVAETERLFLIQTFGLMARCICQHRIYAAPYALPYTVPYRDPYTAPYRPAYALSLPTAPTPPSWMAKRAAQAHLFKSVSFSSRSSAVA